jgi:hypothetical protein
LPSKFREPKRDKFISIPKLATYVMARESHSKTHCGNIGRSLSKNRTAKEFLGLKLEPEKGIFNVCNSTMNGTLLSPRGSKRLDLELTR